MILFGDVTDFGTNPALHARERLARLFYCSMQSDPPADCFSLMQLRYVPRHLLSVALYFLDILPALKDGDSKSVKPLSGFLLHRVA